MNFKPTKKQTKQFYKLMAKKYGAKVIYTGGIIGKVYKRIVAMPLIKKACKQAKAGDPAKWLEDRIITAGKYILMNEKIGSNKVTTNWEQIKILIHECMHVAQQAEDGTLPFYVKYVRSSGLRANFELEAIKTELYMEAWNERPLPSANEIANKLSRIYGFDKDTLQIIKTSAKVILKEFNKNGKSVLSSSVTRNAVSILNKIK